MAIPRVNGTKIRQAVEKFGSLQKASEALANERLALERRKSQLKKEIANLERIRAMLLAEVKTQWEKLTEHLNDFQLVSNVLAKCKRQYELFESFLAMVAGSPSATTSVKALIHTLGTLVGSGWSTPRNADDLRSLFVRSIMGDYLKCFHCDNCGASFITNKKPSHRYYANTYVCPACRCPERTRADDSFLRAMVSQKQLENIQLLEELQRENETLRPFKELLDLPCNICGQPITERGDQGLRTEIIWLGWAHARCRKRIPG